MLINKHNLSIAAHCADRKIDGYNTDCLGFTDTGTMAIHGHYSIAVTALLTDDDERGAAVPVAAASMLQPGEVNVAALPAAPGGFPHIKERYKSGDPQFEFVIDGDHLLALAKSAVEFGAEKVRVRCMGKNRAIELNAYNESTGQKWEALLMPILASAYVEPTAPVDDIFGNMLKGL